MANLGSANVNKSCKSQVSWDICRGDGRKGSQVAWLTAATLAAPASPILCPPKWEIPVKGEGSSRKVSI